MSVLSFRRVSVSPAVKRLVCEVLLSSQLYGAVGGVSLGSPVGLGSSSAPESGTTEETIENSVHL